MDKISPFNSMKKYVIVDMSNLLFHCAHGTFFWYSKNFDISQYGEDIQDVDWTENPEFYSFFKNKFLRELRQVTKRVSADFSQVIFARDCSSKDIWRCQLYPAYKANRRVEAQSTQPNFGSVFKKFYKNDLPEICEQYGCFSLDCPNAEADDVIASIVKYLQIHGCNDPIYIISTDKDLHQLVSHNVKIINQISEEIYSLDNIDPDRHIFMKVILGDAGDNVPQLKERVGKKTAEKWWNDYEGFSNMLKGDKELEEKFNLNYTLLCLDRVPQEIHEAIHSKLESHIDLRTDIDFL